MFVTSDNVGWGLRAETAESRPLTQAFPLILCTGTGIARGVLFSYPLYLFLRPRRFEYLRAVEIAKLRHTPRTFKQGAHVRRQKRQWRCSSHAITPCILAQTTYHKCQPVFSTTNAFLQAKATLMRAFKLAPVSQLHAICYSALRWIISGLPGVTPLSPLARRSPAVSSAIFPSLGTTSKPASCTAASTVTLC